MSTQGERLLKRMTANKYEDSWAVWETDSSGDLTGGLAFPVVQAKVVIHSRVIVVALNPGGSVDDSKRRGEWGNFHVAKKHNDHLLAHAFVGTPFWGAYLADLIPDLFESDSGKVKTVHESAVEALVQKTSRLGANTIICLGSRATEAVQRHLPFIEKKTGIAPHSIYSIWHYSGSNAGKHKNDPQVYRNHVHERLGLT